jgi:hypothetical protein
MFVYKTVLQICFDGDILTSGEKPNIMQKHNYLDYVQKTQNDANHVTL